MFIRTVDQALEKMVRVGVPLPEQIGDVSFDPPTSNWAAQLSRITVNFFLCDVGPSGQPNRSRTTRVDENGKMERRFPQPMIRLGYLISAWAGTPRDEHQLLGDVLSVMASRDSIAEEMFSSPPTSSVTLMLVDDVAGGKVRDLWSGAGGQLKASFILQAHIAADSFDWVSTPTVSAIDGFSRRVPEGLIRDGRRPAKDDELPPTRKVSSTSSGPRKVL